MITQTMFKEFASFTAVTPTTMLRGSKGKCCSCYVHVFAGCYEVLHQVIHSKTWCSPLSFRSSRQDVFITKAYTVVLML